MLLFKLALSIGVYPEKSCKLKFAPNLKNNLTKNKELQNEAQCKNDHPLLSQIRLKNGKFLF